MTPLVRRVVLLALAAPAIVLGSSALGLILWLRHFAEVWAASAVGSAVFAVGTLVATYAAIALGTRRHPGYALAVAILLNWCVYAAAWSLTGPAMFSPETHEIPAPREYLSPYLVVYVAQQGFLGLLACGGAAWWASAWLARAKGS